jgi:hypothetical protein
MQRYEYSCKCLPDEAETWAPLTPMMPIIRRVTGPNANGEYCYEIQKSGISARLCPLP